jgi:hypothetical protein
VIADKRRITAGLLADLIVRSGRQKARDLRRDGGGQGRDRTADLPLFRRSWGLHNCVSAAQTGSAATSRTGWITCSAGLAPFWPHDHVRRAHIRRLTSVDGSPDLAQVGDYYLASRRAIVITFSPLAPGNSARSMSLVVGGLLPGAVVSCRWLHRAEIARAAGYRLLRRRRGGA